MGLGKLNPGCCQCGSTGCSLSIGVNPPILCTTSSGQPWVLTPGPIKSVEVTDSDGRPVESFDPIAAGTYTITITAPDEADDTVYATEFGITGGYPGVIYGDPTETGSFAVTCPGSNVFTFTSPAPTAFRLIIQVQFPYFSVTRSDAGPFGTDYEPCKFMVLPFTATLSVDGQTPVSFTLSYLYPDRFYSFTTPVFYSVPTIDGLPCVVVGGGVFPAGTLSGTISIISPATTLRYGTDGDGNPLTYTVPSQTVSTSFSLAFCGGPIQTVGVTPGPCVGDGL